MIIQKYLSNCYFVLFKEESFKFASNKNYEWRLKTGLIFKLLMGN